MKKCKISNHGLKLIPVLFNSIPLTMNSKFQVKKITELMKRHIRCRIPECQRLIEIERKTHLFFT